MDNNSVENKSCIDIERMNTEKEFIPVLENINAFILLEEYSRASDLADKIIIDKPASPVGWFAKAVVVSNNFKAKSLCDENFIDKYKIYEKNIQNAIKTANDETKEYISEKHNDYERECIEFTESAIVDSLSILFDNVTKYNLSREETCVLLGKVFDEDMKERLSYAWTKDNSNIYINLYDALLRVNYRNYKSYESGYTTLTDETIEGVLELMSAKPRKSSSDMEDMFISVILQVCSFLHINPGNIHNYYTEKKLKEYEEEKRIEKEKRLEEERRLEEELERELEEEERKLHEQRKKEKTKKLIKTIVVIIALVAAAVLIITTFNNITKEKANEPTTVSDMENNNTEKYYVYVMADDCTAINIRTGPGKNYDVVAVIRDRSIKMHPMGMTDGDWIAVGTDEYGEAWVNKDVVKMVEEEREV